MTVADRLSPGKSASLPREAGDENAPRFEPDERWLRDAAPRLQKLAMWRWFATRYGEPELNVPHDDAGEFVYPDGGPYLADEVLRDRFEALVSPDVIEDLVREVQAESGNEWALKRTDSFGG